MGGGGADDDSPVRSVRVRTSSKAGHSADSERMIPCGGIQWYL